MSGFQRDQGGPYCVSSPADVLDYAIDWSNLLATGETIVNSSWTVGATLVLGQTSMTSSKTSAFISGGVDGVDYPIVNSITTSGGRTFARSFQLRIHAGI